MQSTINWKSALAGELPPAIEGDSVSEPLLIRYHDTNTAGIYHPARGWFFALSADASLIAPGTEEAAGGPDRDEVLWCPLSEIV